MSVDLRWKVSEESKLWLKWSKVEHLGDGTIKLYKPKLYGPVLSDCLPLEESGHIILDLTEHFILLIPEPYHIIVKWNKKISQTTAGVTFDYITIEDNKLGCLKLLKNKDKILIDCTDHTKEKMDQGVYKFAFNSMVYNEHDSPYNLTQS